MSRAAWLALNALRGEMGHPSALSAAIWGFQEVLFRGNQLRVPSLEIGVELARNSVQRQEGFAQEEKVERHWMALQSQLLHDLERGVQWIASALRQRNPDGLPITLEYPASGPLAMARRR
jgi:hypothetical protein